MEANLICQVLHSLCSAGVEKEQHADQNVCTQPRNSPPGVDQTDIAVPQGQTNYLLVIKASYAQYFPELETVTCLGVGDSAHHPIYRMTQAHYFHFLLSHSPAMEKVKVNYLWLQTDFQIV